MNFKVPLPEAARADFAVQVSDGLRRSAGAIQSTLNQLADTGLNSDQRELAAAASQHIEALLGTVNNLLDLSQLEAGRVTLSRAAFDLRLLAEDVVQLLSERAEKDGCDLVLRYSPRLPRRAIGHSGRIRQILLSLLRDAMGHLESGFEAEREDRADPWSICVDLEFAEAEFAPRSVEPAHGFRVVIRTENSSPASLRQDRARDLGPVIAGHLVKLMGGSICSPSSSIRQVSIPLDRDLDEWPARKPPVDVAGQRVLIVERNPKAQAALRETLEFWGMRVELAAGRADAIGAISKAGRSCAYRAILVSTEIAGADWESLAREARPFSAWQEADRILLAPVAKMPGPAVLAETGFKVCLTRNPRYRALVDALSRRTGAPEDSTRVRLFETSFRSLPIGAPPSFNYEDVLQRCGGDRELLAELAASFEKSSADLLKRLIEAVARQDAVEALACAQNVRSRAELLAAEGLRFAVERLKHTVEFKHWSAAPAAVSGVKIEFLRLAAELEQLRTTERAP